MQNDPSQTSEADADGCSWLVAARVAMRTIVLGAALTIETVVSSAAFLPRQGVRIRVWPWLPNRGSAEPVRATRCQRQLGWIGIWRRDGKDVRTREERLDMSVHSRGEPTRGAGGLAVRTEARDHTRG